MTCIQCNSEAIGKFCSICGQKQTIPRLTISTFFADFLNRIYGLDGAVPNTIIGLWKYPSRVSKEYIKGIRGKYVGPVGYYFLMFTIYFILIAVLKVDMAEYTDTQGINDVINGTTAEDLDKDDLAFQDMVQKNIFENLHYFTILLFPFFALWAKVFYRKSGFNFLEHIVFLFFTNAQMLFINMTGIIVYAATGLSSTLLISLAGILYFGLSASLFYSNKFSIKTILKSFLYYLVSFITFFLLAGIVGVLIKNIFGDIIS
jgi:hypothetical protein